LVKYTLWCLIDDLDLILTEGDKLNKSFNTNNYLSAHDLSLTIELGGFSSTVIFRELLDCEVTLYRISIVSLIVEELKLNHLFLSLIFLNLY